jgi:hypothetical protein
MQFIYIYLSDDVPSCVSRADLDVSHEGNPSSISSEQFISISRPAASMSGKSFYKCAPTHRDGPEVGFYFFLTLSTISYRYKSNLRFYHNPIDDDDDDIEPYHIIYRYNLRFYHI